jgi:serine/threonine-protein kinase
MTPEYASPEQVRGLHGLHVTTATDVYSLGVVLYELLTGVRPYRLKDASPEEVSRAVCDSQPSKPSEALRDGRAGEGTDGVSSSGSAARTRERVSRSHLKGDIDNIVLKALRKEPGRRYGSVGQLSEDIGRHLKGLPVAARRDTFVYRATKFVGRNRVAVSAAAFVAVAVIAGLIVALWQADAARRQRDLAQRERIRAERLNTFLQRMLSFSNQSITSVSPVAQSRDVTVNEMLDEITPQVETELADQPEVRAQVLRTIGGAYASQGQYDGAEKNLRAALDVQTRLYGEESAEAAATMLELGVLSYRQTKLDEANRLLEKTVAFYRKQRQANAPDYSAAKLALASDYLGVVKFYQGDVKVSLALMTEALQISSGAHLQGTERGVLTFNKSDLGAILVTLGEVEKGEPLLREAEAEYRQTSSQPRWELGVTLMQLGAAALSRNRPDEAQKYLLESEQILRHTLGDKNVYLSGNLVGQAFAFSQKYELPAAEEKARAALAMCRDFSPDNKLPWVTPMWTLADVLTKAGRVREGEDYYRQALTIDEEQTTKNYLFIAQLKIRLGQSLLAQNRLPEAERVALEARGDVTRDLGEQHPLLKAATDLLLKIYEKQGRHDSAQSLR